MLETLRGVLDTLAGPQPAGAALDVALVALCRGLAPTPSRCTTDGGAGLEPVTARAIWAIGRCRPPTTPSARGGARPCSTATSGVDRARPVGPDVVAVPIAPPDGRAVLTAWWGDTDRLSQRRARPARRRRPLGAAWPSSARRSSGQRGSGVRCAARTDSTRLPLTASTTSCARRSPPSRATRRPCARPT